MNRRNANVSGYTGKVVNYRGFTDGAKLFFYPIVKAS